jgi:hypothetical protein
MTKNRSRYLRTAILALLVVLPVYAKVPIEKIAVSGPALAKPAEATDAQLLKLSNPWDGSFAEWSQSLPTGPTGVPVYKVVLYARLGDSESKPELRPIYAFRYAPGQNSQPGQIYLPGKGEPEYDRNVSTILREGHDGRWQPAKAEWESRMKAVLGLR